MAGESNDVDKARELAAGTLRDGSAWRKFRELVDAQDGDVAQLDAPDLLPSAAIAEPILAPTDGYVSRLDAREVGYVVVSLGGGRARKDDPIDPAVGVQFSPTGKVGSKAEAGKPLLWVYACTSQALATAQRRLLRAYSFAREPVLIPPLIHGVIRAQSPSLTSNHST